MSQIDLEPVKEDRLLKAKDVAELLNVCRATVYKLHKAGNLPGIAVSEKCLRFPLGGMLAFKSAQTT